MGKIENWLFKYLCFKNRYILLSLLWIFYGFKHVIGNYCDHFYFVSHWSILVVCSSTGSYYIIPFIHFNWKALYSYRINFTCMWLLLITRNLQNYANKKMYHKINSCTRNTIIKIWFVYYIIANSVKFTWYWTLAMDNLISPLPNFLIGLKSHLLYPEDPLGIEIWPRFSIAGYNPSERGVCYLHVKLSFKQSVRFLKFSLEFWHF